MIDFGENLKMKLTSEMVKEAAFKAGCGDVGIANIERFKNAPYGMHPKNIFPDCQSIICIVQPIPRGAYRGIIEGTHWHNYGFFAYSKLNTLYRPLVTYETSCFIEDHGFEAVPVYPAVPERPGNRPQVAKDRPAPDVDYSVRIAAVAAGLGEIGWSKVFLHKKYGPRVRIGSILTDARLEPDPLVEPGTLCDQCMRCAADCPGAIPHKKDNPKMIRINIEDKTYKWADVHMGRCTLSHHGFNKEVSPFLLKDFPGFDLYVRKSNMSEECAYKFSYGLARAKWPKTVEFPAGTASHYYSQILEQCGYFAVCGAKGCIRGCMAAMEKKKKIEQSNFKTPLYKRKQWKLPEPGQLETGGIAEGKYPERFLKPDENPGNWK